LSGFLIICEISTNFWWKIPIFRGKLKKNVINVKECLLRVFNIFYKKHLFVFILKNWLEKNSLKIVTQVARRIWVTKKRELAQKQSIKQEK